MKWGNTLKRRSHSRSFIRVARARMWDGQILLFFLIFVSLVLLLLSSVYPSLTNTIRMQIIDQTAPIVERVGAPFHGAVETVRNVSGIATLQEENTALIQENQRLREWFHTVQRLEAENVALKKLLNVRLEPAHNHLTARVLSDAGMTFVKSLILNAGSASDVSVNDAVLSGQGVIGRVVDVSANSSRILLVTDVNSRIPVIIEGADKHAIMAGTNTSNPVLAHIAQDTNLKEGARVVTSGFGGVFPAGLPVGAVQKSESGYEVALFSDFSSLQYVRVVKTPKDTHLKKNADSNRQ